MVCEFVEIIPVFVRCGAREMNPDSDSESENSSIVGCRLMHAEQSFLLMPDLLFGMPQKHGPEQHHVR